MCPVHCRTALPARAQNLALRIQRVDSCGCPVCRTAYLSGRTGHGFYIARCCKRYSRVRIPTCSHFSLQPLFPSRILSSAKAMAAELKAEVEGLVAKISDKVRQLGSKRLLTLSFLHQSGGRTVRPGRLGLHCKGRHARRGVPH